MAKTIIPKPTYDEMATVGSIANKPKDMAAAHRAVVLRNSWQRVDTTWHQWQEQLSEAMKERIWEEYPKEDPAGDLTKLLEALEIDPKYALSRDKFSDRPIRKPGRPRKEEKGYDHNLFTGKRGDGTDYLTARIARDRPDILEAMRRGEYDSVRQAAIAAGIVNPKTRYSLPDDPIAAAHYLAQRVDREWFLAMVDEYMKAAAND
jgi:hypothetical protein